MMMRFATITIIAMALGGASAFAPHQQQHITAAPPQLSTTTSLPVHTDGSDNNNNNNNNNWGVAVASAFAGLTLAAQSAVGAMAPVDLQYQFVTTIESSPTLLSAGVETMDFSLPSYGDAVKDSVKSTTKAPPPSFNPFGDNFGAPPEAPKMPEISLPSIKAPPKPEPVVEVETPELPKMPEISLPSIQAPEMPKFEAPKMDLPSFKAPEMPKDLPSFKAPEMPKNLPSFKAPEMPKDLPSFKAPEMPKNLPSFKAPEMPKDLPSIPKFEMPKSAPKVPDYDFGDIPKVSVPPLPNVNIPNPFAGSGKPQEPLNLASREVRDENARSTRQDLLDAEKDVKEAEKVLDALKQVRNTKKQVFNEAKDLACADRPGGKILCLRNPFASGF